MHLRAPPVAAALLLFAPVLSEGDIRVVDVLAARAGMPKGSSDHLSADLTGDGNSDVLLIRRRSDLLILMLVEGPVTNRARWWQVAFRPGTGSGDVCVPPSQAKLEVEDPDPDLAQLGCRDDDTADFCATLRRLGAARHSRRVRGVRIEGGNCRPIHVFFDGSDLRYWRR
jgi:hypothetical protein